MKENPESFMEMILSEKSVTMQHDLKTIWRGRELVVATASLQLWL